MQLFSDPTDTPDPTPAPAPPSRWRFLRDVLVFQLKLMLGNLQNFVLVPLSLCAAAIDLVFKHGAEREGRLFYEVLALGRATDEAIDVYSPIGGYHATGGKGRTGAMKDEFTVDAVLARVEGVILREYEKGATTARIKAAVDRAIDELQARGGGRRERVDEAVRRATAGFRRRAD